MRILFLIAAICERAFDAIRSQSLYCGFLAILVGIMFFGMGYACLVSDSVSLSYSDGIHRMHSLGRQDRLLGALVLGACGTALFGVGILIIASRRRPSAGAEQKTH